MKELILILLILTSGCGKNDKKETMEYIKWLGDQSVNMEIGGDADAYRTLLWAKDQKELSKEKMEEHYKSYQEKRGESWGCRDSNATVDYQWECDGWWHTFIHGGKIYNCLPQFDSKEKLRTNEICYGGERLICHVNSDNITVKKIKKSCEWNKKTRDIFAGQFAIPKRMEEQ